jgi:hypothetical protein
MPPIVRETFENFKPNVYGPCAFSQNLPFSTHRSLRANLGKRVKPPHADFPLALAGLRNVV